MGAVISSVVAGTFPESIATLVLLEINVFGGGGGGGGFFYDDDYSDDDGDRPFGNDDRARANRLSSMLPPNYSIRAATGNHLKPCLECDTSDFYPGSFYVYDHVQPRGSDKYSLDCAEMQFGGRGFSDEDEDDTAGPGAGGEAQALLTAAMCLFYFAVAMSIFSFLTRDIRPPIYKCILNVQSVYLVQYVDYTRSGTSP